MPKIELAKTYEAKSVEDGIYKKWEESGFFNSDKLPDERKESFSIAMPPPNVTGILHLGHAFENALMDIQIRYQRMNGKRALLVPGTDHAAVATQARVEDELKKQGIKNPRQDLGREELLKRIRAFAEDHKQIIIAQIKKMGTSCDWSRLAYTFDEKRSRAVNELFREMFNDGLIYRGYRVVNWSVKGQSTCSDDELVYETRKTKVYTFKYSDNFPIPIATTRPETKLGDTAVAVNPADERYKHLIGQKFTVDVGAEKPLIITIIADKNVDMNYGTGAVGVTPAHSQIDFEMYQNNKDIGIIPVIGQDGRMLKAAGNDYAGLTILEAREKFVDWLKEKKLFISEEEIEHNVGLSDRFGDVVEALPMEQWFVDVNKTISGRNKSLKGLMRDAVTVGHKNNKHKIIKITPERFHDAYLRWIDNLRDWCISRQIWWGHRIPVWYCLICGDDNGDIKVKHLIDKTGDVIDTEISAKRGKLKPIVSINKPDFCPYCKNQDQNTLVQDPDTLDTWFSSGAWTFSTLGWPEATSDLKNFHPTSWMQMGYEILFFWMARMILMTTYALDDIPFHEVYFHGILRDKNGRKFSKSLGNGLDPLEVIARYGTDALRLSLIKGVTAGNDSRFYEEKVEAGRNFVNKLWNISRYIFSAAVEARIIEDEPAGRSLADEWIFNKLKLTAREVSRRLDQSDFSGASEILSVFTWSDFADWYLEIAKIEKNKEEVLLYILQQLLKLWHPFIPFVTEEIWQNFGGGLLLIESWPKVASAPGLLGSLKNLFQSSNESSIGGNFELIKEIIVAVRNMRMENKIPPAQLAKALIFSAAKSDLIEEQQEIIKKLARLEELTITRAGEKPPSSAVQVIDGAEIYLNLSGLIDIGAEKSRLSKEIEAMQRHVKSLEFKLADKEFISRAPVAIVTAEKDKFNQAREKLNKLQNQLSSL